YADWVEMGKEGFRAAAVGRIAILQPPGEYSVVLSVGDKEQRQSLRVLKDPHSEGTEDDIRLQTEMMAELQKDLSETADSINRIEWIRKQLQDLRSVVKELGAKDSSAVVSGAEELEGTLVALEEKLYELKVTDRGQDRVRWPTMLAGRIAYLANAVSVADFRPADQHREVHQVLKERLRAYQQELDSLLENEIPAFNRTLRERDLPTVLTGGPA
ncbi:MAG TPA: sialidase, partial [Vicinamibacteria bacterium]